MKKLMSLFLVLTILFSMSVYAQDDSVDPGTTPDDAFWGLDVAMDKLSLALTFNSEKKAEKALDIAEERLAEVKLMIKEKKVEKSEKAVKEHTKMLLEAEDNLGKLKLKSSEEEFEKELEFEQKIQKQKDEVLEIESEIKLKIKGELTPEQQAKLEEFLASLSENVKKVDIKVKNKKDETRIRLRQELGDDKADEVEGKDWQRKTDSEQEKAQKEIEKAATEVVKVIRNLQM